ncbi:hypothetical protein FOZ62_006818, partial [Perkinsus olseni]
WCAYNNRETPDIPGYYWEENGLRPGEYELFPSREHLDVLDMRFWIFGLLIFECWLLCCCRFIRDRFCGPSVEEVIARLPPGCYQSCDRPLSSCALRMSFKCSYACGNGSIKCRLHLNVAVTCVISGKQRDRRVSSTMSSANKAQSATPTPSLSDEDYKKIQKAVDEGRYPCNNGNFNLTTGRCVCEKNYVHLIYEDRIDMCTYQERVIGSPSAPGFHLVDDTFRRGDLITDERELEPGYNPLLWILILVAIEVALFVVLKILRKRCVKFVSSKK